ncbi:restriction endonuclease subunit S [Vibrio diabolicus]|uniref:restriction endonuclease subunit S n=1 Tax=Vibrio diabolicus TaxID=50719 RepID=UPI0037511678
MVPNGWQIKTVGQLYEVQLGKMLNKAAKEKLPQYPYIGNSDVRWGYFNLSDLKSMHFNDRETEKFTLKKGDILMCEGGEVGRCAIWDRENTQVYYQKALHRLRGKGDIVPEYFQAFMLFINGTKLLDDFTTKTSIAHLTREKLLELPVKTPPLKEQRKIAKILSTWDKAISTTEKLIETSKQQKKALMQQLLTGKKRLVNPETGKAFEGEWEEVHVSDIATTKKGKALSAKDIVVGKYPVIAGGKSSPYTHNNFTHENAITISASGAYAGYVSYHPYKIWASDCSVIEAKVNNCLGFIFQWLLLNQNRIYSMQSGGAQPHIYPKDIDVLRLRKPQFDEQQKIASVLTAADKEIEILEAKLAHFKQEKKALMQQLLTGKRRVKIEEMEVA